MPKQNKRRICFVTGTRAEFGLMRSTLEAIAKHPDLQLQLIVTGMHLDRARGRSIDAIRKAGWHIDSVVPWNKGNGTESANAIATGKAIAAMGAAFTKLNSDIVLVVGDRVEAFAAASAAHIGGRLVAHVHGGDRALGLIDDSLRHAITKLAHIHFPATKLSAERIAKMGEDRWRIIRAGSPGLDGIRTAAAPRAAIVKEFPGISPRRYALLVLHPHTTDAAAEHENAKLLVRSVLEAGLGDLNIPWHGRPAHVFKITRHGRAAHATVIAGTRFEKIVIIHPNNDPGSEGIARAWNELAGDDRFIIRRDVPRPIFLGLLRDAAVLAGNSSSGIIEAASFGTPVIDIGHRQAGRERGSNVTHCEFRSRDLIGALRQFNTDGQATRFTTDNIYGAGGAGRRIAASLASITPDRFRRKLICY
jgi:UDP-N-acetylglucosamine 2-epimerase